MADIEEWSKTRSYICGDYALDTTPTGGEGLYVSLCRNIGHMSNRPSLSSGWKLEYDPGANTERCQWCEDTAKRLLELENTMVVPKNYLVHYKDTYFVGDEVSIHRNSYTLLEILGDNVRLQRMDK